MLSLNKIAQIFRALLWVRSAIQNFVIFRLKRVSCQTPYRNIKGVIRVFGHGQISIKHGARLNSGHRYNPIGGDRELSLVTGARGKIIIGRNSGLSNCTIVSHSIVQLGSDVKIGGGVKIYDTDFHNLDPTARRSSASDIPISKPVVIGDGAFVGAHSIILKGVTIGTNSVIGAGSVVTKNIPDGEIWAGNPATFIRNA